MTTYSTIDDVRAKAAEMELAGINFLKEDGSFTEGDRASLHHADLLFIDGTKLTIDRDTIHSPDFAGMNFKLVPSKPHA